MHLLTPLLVITALANPTLTTAKIVVIKSTGEAPFFSPTNTTADFGDILEFHFKAHNRSIVRGDYDRPCEPAASNGFYSGFFVQDNTNTENSTVFRVTVNDTDPIVYYCSQNGPEFGNHCKDHGMAGVINEPDVSRLQEYRDVAASVNTSITPDSDPFGGVFAANQDAAAVSGTASATSMPASTSTSAAAGGWNHVWGLYCWPLSVVIAILAVM